MKRFCLSLFAIVAIANVSFAVGPQERFARRFNRQTKLGIPLHHAMFRRGSAEVVATGVRNEAEAMQVWMNSPPHKALIESGKISRIICTGNTCVGR